MTPELLKLAESVADTLSDARYPGSIESLLRDQAKAAIASAKQAEPTRALYYVVMFRSAFNGKLKFEPNGGPFAERRHAEMCIELAKAKGDDSDFFIATLSVPVSEVER